MLGLESTVKLSDAGHSLWLSPSPNLNRTSLLENDNYRFLFFNYLGSAYAERGLLEFV